MMTTCCQVEDRRRSPRRTVSRLSCFGRAAGESGSLALDVGHGNAEREHAGALREGVQVCFQLLEDGALSGLRQELAPSGQESYAHEVVAQASAAVESAPGSAG